MGNVHTILTESSFLCSGYPLQSHSGALWGFWSRASVLPDMNMGVYMVANGPLGGQAGQAMRKIELLAYDLFLGEEPW